MLQELIRLHLFGHTIPIYGYGFMLVVGFFACMFVGQWIARHIGIDPDTLINAVLLGIVTGMIGARLCSVLENFSYYFPPGRSLWEDLKYAANFQEGGLTFYGGFLLATPCLIAYARWHRIPVLRGMDMVAPLLLIGLGLGRVGCYLNGCCYGERCDTGIGVRFPYYSEAYMDQFSKGEVQPPRELMRTEKDGEIDLISPYDPEMQSNEHLREAAAASRALPVQPTELYSMFTALLLAGAMIAYLTLPHRDGSGFALMLILEGFGRFLLELVRVEPAVWTLHTRTDSYGVSISMFLGIANVIAGAVMWLIIRRWGGPIQIPRPLLPLQPAASPESGTSRPAIAPNQ